MLTLKDFEKYLNYLKEFNEADSEFYCDIEKHFGPVELGFPREMADKYLELLIQVMDDEDDAIGEFMYECEFGKIPFKRKNPKTKKEITIRTAKQLWKYLNTVKNFRDTNY